MFGEDVKHGLKSHGALVPNPEELWYIDDDHKQQKRPSLQWETVIEDILPKETAFDLRVRGQVCSQGRPVEVIELLGSIVGIGTPQEAHWNNLHPNDLRFVSPRFLLLST